MIKVLIVDDNDDIAKTTAMVFKALGCETKAGTDPNIILPTARDFAPDLIILDIGMPEKNGYELCRELRSSGFSDTLIIAHTGWGNEKDHARAKEAGFNEVLTKPVKIEDFRHFVDLASQTSD